MFQLSVTLALFLHSFAWAQYSGLGAESVDAKTLTKFAAAPLDPEFKNKIQKMLDIQTPGIGAITDDGKQIFFTWRISGSLQIWKVDLASPFPVQMTAGTDMTTISGFTPDGKWVIVGRDRNGEENPGLYLLSRKGGPLIEIQHKPKVQTFFEFVSDDSQWLYFRANDISSSSFAIYRYNLKYKTTEKVFDEPGLWNIADASGGDNFLLSKSTGSLSNEVYKYNLNDKTLVPLFGQGESFEFDTAFGAGTNEILVLTQKFGNFRRLYRFQNKKFSPITKEISWDVSRFLIDHSKRHLYYTVNENGYHKVFAMDARTFTNLILPKFKGAEQVYFGSASRNGRFLTLGVEAGGAPRVTQYYDWNQRKLLQWSHYSVPEIDPSTFMTSTLDYYPSRDGAKIPMFVRIPPSCDDKLCPIVVDFHGGPEGQSVPGYSGQAQLFTDEGFIYVQPNVRGSDGYGKKWIESDNGAKRLNVITDIEDASVYLRKRFTRDGKVPKIGILGGSYGGYSALIGMTMFAGSYDAGTSIVGISNLETFLNNTAPYRRILRITEYGDPEKDKEVLKKLSPVTYIDKTAGPMLIIQGAMDPRVPVGEAIQMYEKMKKKKQDSQLIIFADEGHGSQKMENRVIQLGHTLQFFNKHLKEANPKAK